MKPVFIIALVAVAMIGVMVPSGFAEEIRLDKSNYFKGEGILFYVTNGVENTKYHVIMPNGNQQTVTLWGSSNIGYLSTEHLHDSGTYVIQGPNSNVSFTLDTGPIHPTHPQIFDQSEYFYISDYLLYENQTFHIAMKFDYVVYDEPIILNIFNPSGVSIGSKILEYDLDNWNIRIPLNDFDIESIGKHKVTLTHAGTTLQDEIYYAGSPPSINTNGEYSINTAFTGIHKVSAVFENGIISNFNSELNYKDNSIQLYFWSFFDEGSITVTVPHKIIDSPNSPFTIMLNWEEVEFEQTRNSQSNTFKITVKNQYDFLESDYSKSGTIFDDQILMIKGTQSEGSESIEIEDTLYLVNEVQSSAYSCFKPTITTIDGNLLCNLGGKIKIFTMDGNPIVEFGSFGKIHFISTVGNEIYVISSNNESTNIQTFTSKGKLIKTIAVDFEGHSGESLSCCSFIKYDNHIYLKFGYGWDQYTLDGELLIEDLRWMPPPDHVVDSDGNHFGVWDNDTLVKYSKYDETQYLDHPMFDNPTKEIIFTIGFDGNVPDPIPLNHNTLFERIFVDSNDNVITMSGGSIQKFSNDGKLLGEYIIPNNKFGTQGTLSGIGPDDSFFLADSNMLYQYTTKNPVELEEPVPVLKTEFGENKPEIISQKLGIASFVDQTKDPQHYIDRYNNEPAYKEWFDENYSQYSSIYEAVGMQKPSVEPISEPVVEYVPEPTTDINDTISNKQSDLNASDKKIINELKKLIPDWYNVDENSTGVRPDGLGLWVTATIQVEQGGSGRIVIINWNDENTMWDKFKYVKTQTKLAENVENSSATCFKGLFPNDLSGMICVQENLWIGIETNYGETSSVMNQVLEKMNRNESVFKQTVTTEPITEITSTPTCGTGTEFVNGVCEIVKTEEKSKGGGCLIATATYGSEMATEVQQLRELRDNQLLQTQSGTQFMGIFNDVYYSFSPIIADYERENPLFKEAVKLAITPMITSLSLMENANSESEVLGIGISVIMLNIGMYLGVPAVLIVGIRKRI